jgi:DNA-directed RNA polymerase subunit RPC12/RpoP
MSRLVTVATFGTATELMLARARLSASGIEAFVPDELSLATADYLAPGLGGFRLAVPAPLEADARAILDDEGDEDDATLALDDETGVRCAACGSAYVVLETSALARFVNLLLMGIPSRWQKATWRCRKCGHRASDTPAPEPGHPYRTPIRPGPARGPARSPRTP